MCVVVVLVVVVQNARVMSAVVASLSSLLFFLLPLFTVELNSASILPLFLPTAFYFHSI